MRIRAGSGWGDMVLITNLPQVGRKRCRRWRSATAVQDGPGGETVLCSRCALLLGIMIAAIEILVLTLALTYFLTIGQRRQGWVRARKRRARRSWQTATRRKTNFCSNAGPHLNPLPPGRGLALITFLDGSIAGAFIQPEAAGTKGRADEDSRREREGRRCFCH